MTARAKPSTTSTNDGLKAEMRLYTLEVLAADLFAMSCLMSSSPRETLARVHQQMIDGARSQTFPGPLILRGRICFRQSWNPLSIA